ncbi:ciliary-associated calcium-binding coiled-coil protein 1-like isoform X2 [Mya arenaria]|uniref:ciliary-associated calcium-binding coiled-coil protein 1-like isoform X2 n=1 Tax=Mya arenaria TaxID=6604 RepID=UPI0022E1F68A|nr:ciliary-associated calcium-binding coiled-coil protein 1-like isoform X2 [Mya arenaria]XP_052773410.1 ciliary-associated calcium-binding coiled-coil protein 1-like isoform X2 [Mya arenaria]
MSRKGRKGKPSKDEEEEKESLAFKVLTAEQTNELLGFNVLQIQDKLKEIFNLGNYTINLTDAAVLDYYTAAVYWGIQQKFTAQQLSGFFTVMHKLLDNVREKHLSLVDNTMEFNKLFAGIGVEEVKSAGLDFFNLEHVRAISEYVYSSLFQQYRLYLYMFTHSQAEEIIGTDLEVEVAKAADLPFPPPLDEGVEEMIYTEFIATPPPTPTPEPPEEEPDPTHELEDQVSTSDLFAQLTSQDVREVIESVTMEMLGNLQSEIGLKLQDKESQIIQRINKIHKVAE